MKSMLLTHSKLFIQACACGLIVSLVPIVQADVLVPGSNTLRASCNFEGYDTSENLFNYGSGWAGTGFGLTGTQRGAPEYIIAQTTPSGGIPSSSKSLAFKREDRSTTSAPFYVNNPEALGTSVYGGSDQENQDDFFMYAGNYKAADNLSITVRYFVNLDAPRDSSFALRSTTFFANGSITEKFYPAVWLYTALGSDNKFSDLRAHLRVPDFNNPSYPLKNIRIDLPDTPGWWTLGLSFTPDGDVHYFARAGSGNLSIRDYLGSVSTLSPGHTFVSNHDATVMISTTNANNEGRFAFQIMDDIEVFTGRPPVVKPNDTWAGSVSFGKLGVGKAGVRQAPSIDIQMGETGFSSSGE